jgi:hypothetical protein
MSDVKKHTFNQGVDTILKECLAISDQRGSEYEDTWGLKNINTPLLSHVLRLKGTFDGEDEMLDRRWRRLLAMAGMIDVKISRFLGPFKEDTPIDMINYLACFTYLMREWKQTIESRPTTSLTAGGFLSTSVPTFNDDATADLQPLREVRPTVRYADHYHRGPNVLYPKTNGGSLAAHSHMANSHRQDGSPIHAHMTQHGREALKRAVSQSYADSEYGPA